jgi:hypothetical protein
MARFRQVLDGRLYVPLRLRTGENLCPQISAKCDANFAYLAPGMLLCSMLRSVPGFLLFLCIGVSSAFGQRYDLFEVENGELYWRNTYEYQGSADSLRRYVVTMLKGKSFTQNVVRNELGYNGEVRHYTIDCKMYGRTYLNTPRIYWDGEWSGKFTIEVRENRYRVTIYALYFENKEGYSSHYRTQPARKGFYQKEVLKKNQSGFKKNELANMALLSLSLKDQFDIRNFNFDTRDW